MGNQRTLLHAWRCKPFGKDVPTAEWHTQLGDECGEVTTATVSPGRHSGNKRKREGDAEEGTTPNAEREVTESNFKAVLSELPHRWANANHRCTRGSAGRQLAPAVAFIENFTLGELTDPFGGHKAGLKHVRNGIMFFEEGFYTALHIDQTCYDFVLHVVTGHKVAILFPQSEIELVAPNRGSAQWLNPFFPDFKKFPAAKGAHPIVYELKGGDSLFVPTGWPHAVYTVTDTVMVTAEYLNPYPLAAASSIIDTLARLAGPQLAGYTALYGEQVDRLMGALPDVLALSRVGGSLEFTKTSKTEFAMLPGGCRDVDCPPPVGPKECVWGTALEYDGETLILNWQNPVDRESGGLVFFRAGCPPEPVTLAGNPSPEGVVIAAGGNPWMYIGNDSTGEVERYFFKRDSDGHIDPKTIEKKDSISVGEAGRTLWGLTRGPPRKLFAATDLHYKDTFYAVNGYGEPGFDPTNLTGLIVEINLSESGDFESVNPYAGKQKLAMPNTVAFSAWHAEAPGAGHASLGSLCVSHAGGVAIYKVHPGGTRPTQDVSLPIQSFECAFAGLAVGHSGDVYLVEQNTRTITMYEYGGAAKKWSARTAKKIQSRFNDSFQHEINGLQLRPWAPLSKELIELPIEAGDNTGAAVLLATAPLLDDVQSGSDDMLASGSSDAGEHVSVVSSNPHDDGVCPGERRDGDDAQEKNVDTGLLAEHLHAAEADLAAAQAKVAACRAKVAAAKQEMGGPRWFQWGPEPNVWASQPLDKVFTYRCGPQLPFRRRFGPKDRGSPTPADAGNACFCHTHVLTSHLCSKTGNQCPWTMCIEGNVAVEVEVRPTEPDGLGVFARGDIAADTFVMPYVGEYLTPDEYQERGVAYSFHKLFYGFECGPKLTIDATLIGEFELARGTVPKPHTFGQRRSTLCG